MEVFEVDRETVMEGLDDAGRKVILESASMAGPVRLRWLAVIPYYQPLRLSDFEVGVELHR